MRAAKNAQKPLNEPTPIIQLSLHSSLRSSFSQQQLLHALFLPETLLLLRHGDAAAVVNEGAGLVSDHLPMGGTDVL